MVNFSSPLLNLDGPISKGLIYDIAIVHGQWHVP